MKTKNKLVYLKYYECPQVAIDFRTGKAQERPKYIDHDILILQELEKSFVGTPYRGQIYYAETLARITFRNEKWYWSIEPRIECDQEPLISTANLARNYAIEHEDNVPSYYWLRTLYKTEEVYK